MTGAVIFQSTIPVTFGLLFTRWDLTGIDLFAVALALVSGGLTYLVLKRPWKLRAGHLMAGGIFYLVFVVGAVLVVTKLRFGELDVWVALNSPALETRASCTMGAFWVWRVPRMQ
jgi:hypothetical protein